MFLNEKLFYGTIENLGVSIDAGAFARLDRFAEMLVETNKSFNLTAITEPDDVTVKHFADSLSVFKFADIPENASIIDVGTGAGFPGLVLKLARPDIRMTFLDSTRKKLGFIESVLSENGLSADIVHMRAEEAARLPKYREKFDFATARAVASLPVLSEYCLPFVKTGGTFISMKSADSTEEIDIAKSAISILGGKIFQNQVFDLVENTPRRIILIKKNSQTPTKYPRPSAQISKKPLK
ncbi:MAG: 16S rRNA (guanine(527)-N(7))-methyltransferase RsmG [Oscillospiraceae bacterium]|nr:16S rRNA (guanine(527)-N(7))-methyltransferase RsmG [Oscillospiraceae bacterium]